MTTMLQLSLLAICFVVTNGAIGDNVVPSQTNTNEFDEMINHVKALRGHIDGMDIRKEMEYISHKAMIIYRRMFNEFFGGAAIGFTETPPVQYPQFPQRGRREQPEDIYVLGSGSFARYEATGTSDLDVMIIIIKNTRNNANGRQQKTAIETVCDKLQDGIRGYSHVLEDHAHVRGNHHARTLALSLDVAPGCWVRKTAEEFFRTVLFRNLDQFAEHMDFTFMSWEPAKTSQFIDSVPLYLGGNANYHTLQKAFWETIHERDLKNAFNHYIEYFFYTSIQDHLRRDRYKMQYANADEFSAKTAILRPLVLPILYFYQLAFREDHHNKFAHRTTSTLERMYFLAEWGYIDIDAIQAVEHTFLWGNTNQLSANVITPANVAPPIQNNDVQIHHGEKMIVDDGNRNTINDHVSRAITFMGHIKRKYRVHFGRIKFHENDEEQ